MKTKIKELENHLKLLKSEIDALEGKSDFLSESLNNLEINLSELEEDKLNYSKAVEFLAIIQQATRETTQAQFEKIITYAIQYIFEQDDEAKLEFGRRGNLSDLDFRIKLNGQEELINPLNCEGGGLSDIYCLALRLVLLSITKNKGILILDETLKHLDAKRQPLAYEFLKKINESLDKQVLWITHEEPIIEQSEYQIEIK